MGGGMPNMEINGLTADFPWYVKYTSLVFTDTKNNVENCYWLSIMPSGWTSLSFGYSTSHLDRNTQGRRKKPLKHPWPLHKRPVPKESGTAANGVQQLVPVITVIGWLLLTFSLPRLWPLVEAAGYVVSSTTPDVGFGVAPDQRSRRPSWLVPQIEMHCRRVFRHCCPLCHA